MVQFQGQQKQDEAAERAENARKQAAELDASRRRRQIVREMQVARANALATATSQGAQAGSGLQGAYGGIAGQANTALTGVDQNLQLGQEIFAANRQSREGGTQANIGGGISSIGGVILKNRDEIKSVGQYAFG